MEPLGNDRWRGALPGRPARPLAVLDHRLDRPARLVAPRARAEGRGRPDRPRRRARRGRGAPRRRDADARGGARPGRATTCPREAETSLAAPLELIVDRERARFGAWYELFPRSFGGFAGVERAAARRSPRSASTSSTSRRSTRSGARTARARTTRSSPGPDDPGSPWAIGSAEGGHTAVAPELGTLEDLERLVAAAAGARPRDRARPRPPVLARPPLADRAPRVVPAPARTGRSSTPRTRPSATRTSTTSTSTPRTGAALWQALLDVVLTWAERGIRIFRVDNPHTKPVAFWAWLIREAQAVHPDLVFLVRGVHAPGDDGDAREGRLQPVLHLLHLAEHEGAS